MLDNHDIQVNINKGSLCPSQQNLSSVEETNIFLPVQGHLGTQGHKSSYVKSHAGKFLSKLSAKKKKDFFSLDILDSFTPHPVSLSANTVSVFKIYP